MRYFSIFTLILLTLLSSIVFANMYCPDEYCTNQYYSGNPFLRIGSSSFPVSSSQTFDTCLIENSVFPMIAADYDDDTVIENIIFPSTTKMSIYDNNCNLEQAQVIVPATTSRASLVNPDNNVLSSDSLNQLYDIAVIEGTYLSVYGWVARAAPLVSSFDLKYTLNYSNYTQGRQLYALSCTDHNCWAYAKVNNSFLSVHTFALNFGILYLGNGTFSANGYSSGHTTALDNTEISYAQTIYGGTSNSNSYSTYCDSFMTASSTGGATCFVFNTTGGTAYQVSPISVLSTPQPDIQRYSAAFVKMGTLYRYIINMKFLNNNGGTQYSIDLVRDDSFGALTFSTTCPVINSCIYTGLTNTYASDIIVGDFDKDSADEACFFNDTNANHNTTFNCYTNTFTTKKFSYAVNFTTAGLSFPRTFTIIDANISAPRKYLAIMEGIIEVSASGIRNVTMNGYAPADAFTDYPMTLHLSSSTFQSTPTPLWTGTSVLGYADDTRGFITRSVLGIGSCGDGVCAVDETILSCPSDCFTVPALPADNTCTSDLQCTNADILYPTCLGQRCVRGCGVNNTVDTSVSCVSDDDCGSSCPICWEKRCVSAVLGGYTNTTTGALATSPGAMIDNMFNTLFAGSGILRFIVGIALLLFFFLVVNSQYNVMGNPIVTVIIFASFLVMFTFINLINRWVIFSIIAVALSMFIISFILRWKPSASG